LAAQYKVQSDIVYGAELDITIIEESVGGISNYAGMASTQNH
jgi:hypothetical protein